MAYCNQCGVQMGADTRFCTACGADQGQNAQADPAQGAQPQYGQPFAQPTYVQGGYAAPPHAPDAAPTMQPMGVWAYVGSLLLMSLPLAGFILAIVWACGGTSNLNRRNLARATLIIMAIGLILSLLLSSALVSLFMGLAGISDSGGYAGGVFERFMDNAQGQMGAIFMHPFV